MSQVQTRSNLRSDRDITSSQKTMIFILAMAVFGLSELVLEIVPDINIGPVELGISYFAFIPATLAALFAPAQVALGAVTGKVIFSSLLMGDFGGIGELESFIQMSIGIYVAGMLVSNPLNKRQIFWAPVVLVGIDKFVGGVVDTLKVVVGVEEFSAVQGLPESIFAVEIVAFVTDLIISGIIFGAIPALFLVPKLYGKIEPLLGMKPRTARPQVSWSFMSPKRVLIALALFVVSGAVAFAEELGYTFAVWEPDFLDQYGDTWLYAGIAIAVIAVIVVVLLIRKRGGKKYDLDLDEETRE